MTDHSRAERTALADLLDRLGPDEPTLCAGWTTADLAAHLVVREGDPLAAAGIVARPLAERTRQAMQDVLGRLGYAGVVDRFRQGPPRWSPMRIPALDRANVVEFFVHHEDVRRAQPEWTRRELPSDLEDHFWRQVARGGRLLFRRVAVGVLVSRPEGVTTRVRGGEPAVVLAGPPSELVMYAYGRKDAAQVEVGGPDVAVEALAHARFGL